jgi:hypothetical protein
MAVVSAFVFAVVELHVHHRGAFKANLDFDHTVRGGDFQTVDGGVGRNGRLAIGCRNVLVPGLRPLERPAFDDEGIHDFVPDFVALRAVEVVGEQELLLLGNRLFGDGRPIRGKSIRKAGTRGNRKQGEREAGLVHVGLSVRRSFS